MLKKILTAIFSISLLVGGFVVYAYTFSLGWKWMIAEPFGIPSITPVHAFGLIILIGLLLPSETGKFESDSVNEAIGMIIAYYYVRPLLVLGICYCLSYFMR